MATKTISITEDAYNRLLGWKEGKESFSDVITKLAGRKAKWSDLAGLLNRREAAHVEASVKELREAWTEETERRGREIKNALGHHVRHRRAQKG
jgi:predicted CopG family antitoxin